MIDAPMIALLCVNTMGRVEMVVWDLPLRVFHWTFMICVFGAIISGKMQNWDIHERFGLAIMGLVTFRLIWGFIGSSTARFSHFLARPSAVIEGLRDLRQKRASTKAGHSAVGGYATLALLALPLMMALTGSFSTDDILYDGPFYHLMPEWADQAGIIHEIGEKAIFLIILLHLGALAYYYFAIRKNLVPAMVTGRSDNTTGPEVRLSPRKTYGGLLMLVLLVAVAQFATQLRPDFF